MAYNYTPYYNGSFYPQNNAMPDTLNQYKAQYQQPQMPMMQQPMMPQPIPQMPMQTPAQSNDMIWVLSEVEAQSYPVAPNNSVILWDKNNDVVYIKSVNAQGVPSMRVLDYTERSTESAKTAPVAHECKCGSKFVLKEDFRSLQEEIDGLRAEIEKLKSAPKARISKKTADEVENDG